MSYIGNTAIQQAFTPAVDFFNGNNSTVAFTLSRPVASVAQVQAVVENVPQNPGDAYTVSGNTITFTSAPPSGTQNIYVYYTSPITQVIAPGQGTVGTAQIQNGAVIPADLSAGAPTWSPSGGVTLPRIDSTNEGGQLNFNRASDDTAVWSIDSFGGTSTPTLRFINGATVAMAIDGSNNVGIGTSSPSYKTEISAASATNGIGLRVTNSGSTGAGIDFLQSGVDNFSLTMPAGSGGLRFIASGSNERMRIDSSGNLLVGTTSASFSSTNYGVGLTPNGENRFIVNTGVPSIFAVNRNDNGDFVRFFKSGINVGTIYTGGTTTTYATTSDYRLKENVQPMTGALSKVAALKPCTYTWKADGSDGQGFIAHELQEVVPDCVTGEKDAVDENGNPVYQGIDTSFLVATLTAAIQELNAKFEEYKAAHP